MDANRFEELRMDEGEAIRSVFAERPLLAVLAAELFVERMASQNEAFEIELHRDAIAASLGLALHNADMLGAVGEILDRSDLPVVRGVASPAFAAMACGRLLDSLREVADDAFRRASEAAWEQVAVLVIGGLFGAAEDADLGLAA